MTAFHALIATLRICRPPVRTPRPDAPARTRRAGGLDRRLRTRAAGAARVALLAVAVGAAGCVTGPLAVTPPEQVRAQANPADRAQRSITNFTPALRCMDEMLFRAGTRDLTLMMEELRDSTQRVNVSARDMMTSAISDLSRRSRAVRLSVFGSDQAHLLQLLQQAQKNDAFSVLPQYNLRGSISQIDEDVQRDSRSLGVLANRLGLRLGTETRFSVLGFDAALVDTATFTLVPGVTSRNTTVITRRDAGASDGQAQLRSTGVVFSFSAARAEGTAQAARNMVELAAVELVGKLARLPYWQCLGLPDDHPEVQREMDDWFLAMGPEERVRFQQERLRQLRHYEGPADGQDRPALRQALAAAQAASGPGAPVADPHSMPWFRHLITRAVAVPATPAATPAAATTAGSASPQAPLQLTLGRSARGALQLEARIAANGYVYCYAVDKASGSIRRVFPNRFARDPAVQAGQTLQVPGTSPLQLPGRQDFACVHAPREVYADLPPALRWGDFEVVRLPDLQAVREAFATASGQPVSLVQARSTQR